MDRSNRLNVGGLLPRLRPRDAFADLFQGLVPGSLLLFGGVAALVPPIYAVASKLIPPGERPLGRLPEIAGAFLRDTPDFLWPLVLILAAGVLGHLSYLQDPKTPNRCSFRKPKSREIRAMRIRHKRDWLKPWFWTPIWNGLRVWRQAEKDLDEKAQKQFHERQRREYACTTWENCRFPFPYLADYLEKRGMTHLLPFVTWKDDANVQSKIYINLLKVRNQLHEPHGAEILRRNEARIRFSSALWYASRSLKTASLIGILLCAVTFVSFSQQVLWSKSLVEPLPTLAFPVVVFALGAGGCARIEASFHYQRLREIVYVLEFAHTVFRGKEDLLKPPFDDFPPSEGHDANSEQV